jgi:hypothetical protein
VEDVDGDGRPDLWTRGPYASIRRLTGSSEQAEPILPALFVLHSTNAGTFAGDDGVARAVVASLCPRGATLDHALAAPELDEAEARAIVCARVRGATEADVQKALGVRCTQFVSVAAEVTRDHCPSWTKELAATTPPVVLR